MSRSLRSTFATVALMTACLAPPALTRAEREALARALRQQVYPVEIRDDTARIRVDWRCMDMLLFTRAGDPCIVSLVDPLWALAVA